jgi:hypothetical protein
MGQTEPRPTFDQVETRVRELCRSQGLPQPDEFIEADDADEVLALWHDRKVALVIELDE